MAKTGTLTYKDLVNEVDKGVFRPVYLLMGDESYYIDLAADYIASHAITEDEAAFNLFTIYAEPTTQPADIANSARRLPMMAKYQVVNVKECQNVKKWDDLIYYLEKPSPSTILILSYKNGSMDRRKKVTAKIEEVGGVLISNRLKDGMLPYFISDYLKEKNVGIDRKALMMLVENIGSDLSRLTGEIDKLCITLPEGGAVITPELIEKNIGISKDFNQWEFKDAIVKQDVLKANRIINYFCDNPKLNPPIMTVAILFRFFATLMQMYYAPQEVRGNSDMLAKYLDMKSSSQLQDYFTASKHYSAMKTMKIIAKLRETDAKLKGLEKGNATDADVMRELVFFILH